MSQLLVSKSEPSADVRRVVQMSKLTVLSLSGALFLVACQSGSQSNHVEAKSAANQKLVLGTSADYPPFDFRKDGEVTGFDIDVAKEIATRLGRALEVKDMEFSSLIPALQSGQIDLVMAGMTATAERKKNVRFTETYYQAECSLLTRSEDQFSSETAWTGKKIGVQLGTVMEKVAKRKAAEIESLKLVSLAKYPVLLEELKAKRLDGVLMEKVQAQAFSKMNQAFHLVELPDWEPKQDIAKTANPEGYAIAFSSSPAGTELQERADQILRDLKKEGIIDRIKTRWLGEYHD